MAVLELTFVALAAHCLLCSPVTRAFWTEAGNVEDLKMAIWKYWCEFFRVVEWREMSRKSSVLPYFPAQEVLVYL